VVLIFIVRIHPGIGRLSALPQPQALPTLPIFKPARRFKSPDPKLLSGNFTRALHWRGDYP
jgi:hypothetical protein